MSDAFAVFQRGTSTGWEWGVTERQLVVILTRHLPVRCRPPIWTLHGNSVLAARNGHRAAPVYDWRFNLGCSLQLMPLWMLGSPTPVPCSPPVRKRWLEQFVRLDAQNLRQAVHHVNAGRVDASLK